MQELRLVAVSEDGSYVVLTAPGSGGRFSLPIDDRLRIVARGQFSRLAQYEIEVESPLRPKEIQDRIRAGETAEEIADAAGLPIERVRRFEGPVLAERAYRAQEAQSASLRQPGDSGPGRRLGDAVADRLRALGSDPEEAEWDSRKRPDGDWLVQVAFTAEGQLYLAEWLFDPRRKHVSPADETAARLCLPDADLRGGHARERDRATATVTPIGARLGGASAGPEREPRHQSGLPQVPPPARPMVGEGRPAAHRGGAARPAGAADRAAVANARPAGGGGLTAPGQAQVTAEVPAEEAAQAAAARSGQEGAQAAASKQPAGRRPARKAAGGRSRRSSVPSWDEIMFGTSRNHE